MKKNNKGFTLIELLAAVVVLGLLVAISIPLVTKNITTGRNKVYVQDANKFISLAEYRLNSNSIKIQKPDPGNCIVFGLDYLNDGSISSPPNKGTYNPDLSYVVVKNDGRKLEYSVSLVEEHKNGGGFSGVKLSTKEQLNGYSASSRVTGFTSDELICVSREACNRNDVSESRVISEELINERITSRDNHYVEEVEKVYLKEELEQGEPSNASAPKIKKSYVDFDNSVTGVNTVGFVVYVKAIDKDSPGENELSVCVKDSPNKDDIFPLLGRDNSFCEPYTSGTDYYKRFSYTITPEEEREGVTKYFFISVYDNNNNVNTAKFEKRILQNTAPVIKIKAAKRGGDKSNLHIVRLKLLSVRDDRAKMADLSYCVNESGDVNDCEFKSYDETFRGGYYDYTIHDSSGAPLEKPDGNTYTIYVFARDSYGAVGQDSEEYTVSQVTKPEVSYNVVNSTINGKNDLHGYLEVDVNDQYYSGKTNEVKPIVRLTVEGVTTEYEYSKDLKINYSFSTTTADGRSAYDGNNRSLTLEVENVYKETVTKNIVIDNIYKNEGPTIYVFNITGPGYVNMAGSFEENRPSITLNVTDDFDSSVKYCVTEGIGCTSDSEYTPIETNNDITFEHEFTYNGNANKSLTVYVKDNSGEVTTKTVSYPQYVDAAPTISGTFSIISTDVSDDGGGKNINNVIVDTNDDAAGGANSLTITDDSDDYQVKFCYKVVDGGSVVDNVCYGSTADSESNEGFYNYDDLKNILAEGIILTDSDGKNLKHSGQTIKGYFIVKDRFNKKATSSEVDYTLYNNRPPVVTNVENEKVMLDEAKSDNGDDTESDGSYALISYYKVYDPDIDDTYQVCIDTNPTRCVGEFSESFTASNNNSKFSIEARYDEETETNITVIIDNDAEYLDVEESEVKSNFYDITGDSPGKSLYLHIKDSDDRNTTVTLYGSCSTSDLSKEQTTTYEPKSTAINTELCNGVCTAAYSKLNNIYRPYTITRTFSDLIGKFCGPIVEEKNMGCDHYTCLGSNEGDTNEQVIGTVLYIEEGTTEDDDGSTVVCNGYYVRYKTTIENGYALMQRYSDDAYKICDTLIDRYGYDHDDVHYQYSPYLRIDDSETLDLRKYDCDEDENGIYSCIRKDE